MAHFRLVQEFASMLQDEGLSASAWFLNMCPAISTTPRTEATATKGHVPST